MRARIAADRDACVGAGQCVMLAPAVFDQGDDGIVVVLVAQLEADHLAAGEAVALCPARALSLTDE